MTSASRLREAVEAFQHGDLASARSIADAEAASEPSPQWFHLLGLIDCREGQFESGIEQLRRAFEAEPDNLAYRVMLARALTDAGRAEEALSVAEAPSGTSPGDATLWHARAEAGAAAGETGIAVEAWQALADATPRDWRAWVNLGNTLLNVERWPEAADALLKAVELNPSDLTLRRRAGTALVNAGRLEQALDQFDAVASADPNDSANRVARATTLASLQRHEEAIAEFNEARRIGGETVATEVGLGRRYMALLRFDDAAAAFRRAYELEPTERSIVHQLGVALERTNRLEELVELLEQSRERGFDEHSLPFLWAVLARRGGRLEDAHALLLQADRNEEPVAWNALMAKVAEGLGDSAAAFEAATAMNRAAHDKSAGVVDREEWQHNANAYRQGLHELARTITPDWAAKVPLLPEPQPKRLAFLLGFPRSGTTLLDTLLLGHPEVTVLEEKQLVGIAAREVGKIGKLAGVSKLTIERARATYLRLLKEHVGGDFDGVVIDKFPLDMANAPLIQAMFPGSPIIFAQRHPCDVVLSGFMQPFGMVNFSNIADAADYYDAMMSIWTASREAMGLNVHTVVYEEMVRSPESTMRPLLDFLGLDWDERVLDHRSTAKARGTIITPSYDQVTEAISTAPVERWKRYRDQLAPVLPVLLPWAERLGYDD